MIFPVAITTGMHLEVSFRTSSTDVTVYWDREDAFDLGQCRRAMSTLR